jgi:hypothetical protein
MAEPLNSIWRKGCMILSAVLLHTSSGLSRRNISLLFNQIIRFKKVALSKPKFARSIESYLVYMVGDDT